MYEVMEGWTHYSFLSTSLMSGGSAGRFSWYIRNAFYGSQHVIFSMREELTPWTREGPHLRPSVQRMIAD